MMLLTILSTFLLFSSSQALASNSTLSSICSSSDTCSVSGYEGACVSISSGCCSSGVVTSGLCAGSSDIKCCTQSSCNTPAGSGTCMQTSLCSSKGGSSYSGYCSGPSDVQCCVRSNAVCSYSDTCSVSGYEGTCVSISSGCCSSGVVTSGLCPGSSDIKCCTQPSCSTPAGSGTCMQTSLCSSQGGSSYSGYCTGPSDLQCCVKGSSGSTAYGVDISDTLSYSTASCFVSSGLSFVIPRGYCSYGAVDSSVCTSLNNAANAGPTCSKSADTQMSELVSYLNANCKSAWSGRVWLDIEGTQYWYSSTTTNQNWYKALVDSCSTYGVRCGVYSSYYQWSDIFGTTYFSYGSNLPLWYAHYDNNPSFSDFSSFGGWSSPHVKQYAGDTYQCSMGVDKNYAPYGF
eukprot:scaffold96_cov167-Ochromonas_danica.AAC.66